MGNAVAGALGWLVAPLAAAAALAFSASAQAHPNLTPAVVQAGQTQTYTLAVPTEKAGVTTTEVELTVPAGFEVEAFAPAAGWERSGEDVIKWTGGAVPTGEAALFAFVGGPNGEGRYDFEVRQTFSDGSVAEWTGAERPRVEAKASLGGGGGSTLALALAILGVVLGAVALLLRIGEGRELA